MHAKELKEKMQKLQETAGDVDALMEQERHNLDSAADVETQDGDDDEQRLNATKERNE